MEQVVLDKINSGIYKLIKHKGRSKIWTVLVDINKEDDERLPGYTYCTTCKMVLKYNGKQTTNLLRHKCIVNIINQNTIKLGDEEKKKSLEICTKWIVDDCRPFAAVDGAAFGKMIQYFIEIGAKYGKNVDVADLIPHSTSISNHLHSLTKQKKEECKTEIKNIVNEGRATVTTDLWTDNYVKRTFICATLHFEKDLKMTDLILGMKSMDFMRSTGENIRNKLKAILNEFDIFNMNKLTFVTDRGSNIKNALVNYNRINCSNHLLANVLDTAFDSTTELQPTISACKKLVKYFKKSNMQHLLRTSLKNYCVTRWSSHLNLFKSINDNREQIDVILRETFETTRVDEIDFNLLNCLVELCQYFDTISRKFQTTSSPSLYFVLPSITRIKSFCEPTQRDLPAIIVLKTNILKEINEKWITNIHVFHKLALFLYPPANQLQRDINEDNVVELCITAVLEYHHDCIDDFTVIPSTPSNASSSNSSPASKDQQFFFPCLYNESINQPPATVRNEVENYAEERVRFDCDTNLLQWWSTHKNYYPRLAKFALFLHSIPASSASSERAFSLAGNIIVEKRNRLAPKSVDNILFLNSFFKQNK